MSKGKIKFESIPRFTQVSDSGVNIAWTSLEKTIAEYQNWSLDLNPDFQRGHVWSLEQRIRYVEFIMRGGRSSKDILTNCPRWHAGGTKDFVLVDGKQRIESVRMFMRDELPVFGGHVASDFDYLDTLTCHFKWHVNELATRAEVLKWYLDLNSGGVVHTDDELDRVRGLLEAEKSGEVR